MVFTNVINPRSFIERKAEFKATLVKRGASIGANATIVCGITLGQYCLVGAGATVTRDVPDYALVYGNPARLRGWVCYCGDALDIGRETTQIQEASCGSCGRSYRREGRDVRPT
jgi:UDP-2-acetamido-3-amino-2,3-dideoxy-glucuronate N-acetyltransferase